MTTMTHQTAPTLFAIELDNAHPRIPRAAAARSERSERRSERASAQGPLGNEKRTASTRQSTHTNNITHTTHHDHTQTTRTAPEPPAHHAHVEGFTPAPEDRDRTKDRAMRYLRSYSCRAAAKSCMVEPIGAEVVIRVNAETGRGHVSGLKRCASPWACPVCSFKVRNRRAMELTQLVERAQASQGSALLMTATIPHVAGERLSAVLDDLQASWRKMWSGRWAKDFKTAWGIVGTERAIEITWGAGAGWHPHIHAVLILGPGSTLFGHRPGLTDAQLVEMWGALMFRWAEVVKGVSGRTVNVSRAIDLRIVDDPQNVAEYVTDTGSWSIGAEVTSGPVKLGRSSGHWSPFALLAAACTWGDADAGKLWAEYEEATAGRRAIVVSRGLYERYGIDTSTDTDAAEGEKAEEVSGEVRLDPMWWYALGAVDGQRAYVTAVEQWAADGSRGDPPDPSRLFGRVVREVERWRCVGSP